MAFRGTVPVCRFFQEISFWKFSGINCLDMLGEHWPFWRLYFLKTRSLIVLQEYEVEGSSGGVQVISRSRVALMIKIQVKGDGYQC